MSLLPLLVLGAGALALLFAAYLAYKVISEDAGNERVQEIGAAIHEGAMAFLNREYKLLAIFVIIITGVLAVFIDYDVLNKIEGSNSGLPSTAISYIFGAIGSALAGFIGMLIAVKSNMRTATAATKGLNPGLRVAFNSGSVMGMTVVGIGITGITIIVPRVETDSTAQQEQQPESAEAFTVGQHDPRQQGILLGRWQDLRKQLCADAGVRAAVAATPPPANDQSAAVVFVLESAG